MIGVIGGSGFIGSALVRAVHQAGHAVRIIDRAPSQAYPDAWIEADVRDREALRQACRGCGVLGEADETAATRPFNEYGRTKLEAAQVFRAWAERAAGRSLTIIRPTVVFGPDNRGNMYTLLEQIARGRAVVVGDGRNRKLMACVENVVGVLVHALTFGPGVHVFNYADKPDLDMNELTALARPLSATTAHGCFAFPSSWASERDSSPIWRPG